MFGKPTPQQPLEVDPDLVKFTQYSVVADNMRRLLDTMHHTAIGLTLLSLIPKDAEGAPALTAEDYEAIDRCLELVHGFTQGNVSALIADAHRHVESQDPLRQG